MQKITSVQNVRIKQALRLRERRGRDKQGRMLIDGLPEILRAVQAGVQLVEAFVCEELCGTGDARLLVDELARRSVLLVSVTPLVLERLSYGERVCGVLAVGVIPTRTLDELWLPESALVAVLEGIEKPGNLGAVLRSADGAGVAAVVAVGPGTDLYNPNCIRASLGTVFTLPVCAASSSDTLAWLRRKRLTIYAARVDAVGDYRQVHFEKRAALVLGSESQGLSQLWRSHDIVPIRLPMLGTADSLNVSVTAAVLFYEALRQRELPDE